MRFSTKIRYGIRAMLEIALNDVDSGIYQKEIAENQSISYKYLDQIIGALRVAGLITKAGGQRSGYILTRKPSEITMLEIHSAFEPGICVINCLSSNVHCKRESYCAMRKFWGNLNSLIINYFKSTTLQDLMDNQLILNEQELAANG
ncbi:MAG: Rrf2 family transcriptional regulator [Bacteroidales bacterium]|nr:Rrf2 family transcriptional regulator [Bacteroidales bacterium]